MVKIVIPALVDGGKASAGPPLGPAIGPSGLNIGQVIAAINEKTKDFVGMQVPVKVIVDKAAKSFEIEVGTPPVSALIKKELGLKEPVKEEAGVKGKKPIGSLSFEQCVKIARQKKDASLARGLRQGAREVLGTCLSLGALVDGKNPKEVLRDFNQGKYDSFFK